MPKSNKKLVSVDSRHGETLDWGPNANVVVKQLNKWHSMFSCGLRSRTMKRGILQIYGFLCVSPAQKIAAVSPDRARRTYTRSGKSATCPKLAALLESAPSMIRFHTMDVWKKYICIALSTMPGLLATIQSL